MDTNNWRPSGSGSDGEPPVDTGDWRTQLQPDSRQRIVNKIMDTLKRHLPFSGQEGLQELKKIAVRFEEKIYTAATNQSDYLWKISLKMLTMETRSQNPIPNSLPSNSAGNGNKPLDPGGKRTLEGSDETLLPRKKALKAVCSSPKTQFFPQKPWNYGQVGRSAPSRSSKPMDTNNWRPSGAGGEPSIDKGDWRTQLQPDSRQRIVNKITDTLKRHLPFSGQEGLQEIEKIAVRFEEKIYTAATSQSDYVRKIYLKMLTMGTRSQNPIPNSLPSNSTGNGNKPLDPGGNNVAEH